MYNFTCRYLSESGLRRWLRHSETRGLQWTLKGLVVIYPNPPGYCNQIGGTTVGTSNRAAEAYTTTAVAKGGGGGW